MILSALGVLCTSWVVAAPAVAVSSGPDLEEHATEVSLPVDRVMVFSDRARVTRAGHVKLGVGPRVLRAPDLPGAAMLDTLRVSASGARVVRVETRPVQRERWSIDQVDAWLAELETVGDKINLAEGKLGTAREELQLLTALAVAPPVPEKDRLGKPAAPLAPDAWRALQDHLGKRREKARDVERSLERDLRDLHQQYEKARREVQKRDLGGFTDQKVEVLVIVEGEAAEGELSVEYAVPGAFWKPAYDLKFDPDASKVELSASGLVTQATGEVWDNAHLALSTAIPGMGIEMPVIETWALGDDREFVPRPTARAGVRTQRPFLPPAPKPRIADIEKEADRALLTTRSQQLLAMASAGQPPQPQYVSERNMTRNTTPTGASSATEFEFDGDEIGGELASPAGGASRAVRAAPPRSAKPAAPPPAEAPAMMPVPMMKEEAESYDAPSATSSVGSAFGAMVDSISSVGRGPGPSYRGLQLVGGIGWATPVFSDPMLPAVTAGGFDYVYDAPVAVTVPSDAQNLRVPLAARKYDVQTFYEATPSLSPNAYLKAAVKNGSKLPILAGPANIFVKSTFAGDAQLATTGPGGVLELPLGADEDIRLTRTVVPSTKTQGFIFGQEDITDYVVTIEIGNYKKRDVTVRIVDQLPKSNEEKVKVELVSSTIKAQAEADGNGLLYWHIDVPKGGTKKLMFTYRISRPKDWRLSQ